MMRKAIVLLAGTALLRTSTLACDCAMQLPYTFCETLYPTWDTPHVVVLGVKIEEVFYGMRVKVLEVFDGSTTVGDTLMVWGDNGALCRHYAGTWNVGDTIVWGFHETDFMGNFITAGFPPDLEQPGDYHISSCGTYWLGFTNGMITGPIAPGVTSISVPDFWPAMTACAENSISENNLENPLRVLATEGGPWLSMRTSGSVELRVFDTSGRTMFERNWNGTPLQLSTPAGVYFVLVQERERLWMKKVVAP